MPQVTHANTRALFLGKDTDDFNTRAQAFAKTDDTISSRLPRNQRLGDEQVQLLHDMLGKLDKIADSTAKTAVEVKTLEKQARATTLHTSRVAQLFGAAPANRSALLPGAQLMGGSGGMWSAQATKAAEARERVRQMQSAPRAAMNVNGRPPLLGRATAAAMMRLHGAAAAGIVGGGRGAPAATGASAPQYTGAPAYGAAAYGGGQTINYARSDRPFNYGFNTTQTWPGTTAPPAAPPPNPSVDPEDMPPPSRKELQQQQKGGGNSTSWWEELIKAAAKGGGLGVAGWGMKKGFSLVGKKSFKAARGASKVTRQPVRSRIQASGRMPSLGGKGILSAFGMSGLVPSVTYDSQGKPQIQLTEQQQATQDAVANFDATTQPYIDALQKKAGGAVSSVEDLLSGAWGGISRKFAEANAQRGYGPPSPPTPISLPEVKISKRKPSRNRLPTNAPKTPSILPKGINAGLSQGQRQQAETKLSERHESWTEKLEKVLGAGAAATISALGIPPEKLSQLIEATKNDIGSFMAPQGPGSSAAQNREWAAAGGGNDAPAGRRRGYRPGQRGGDETADGAPPSTLSRAGLSEHPTIGGEQGFAAGGFRQQRLAGPNGIGTINPGAFTSGETGGTAKGTNRGKVTGLIDHTPTIAMKTMGINASQWDAYRRGLSSIESPGKYNIMGGAGHNYAGRYQFGRNEVATTMRQLGASGGTSAWLNDPELQEKGLEKYTMEHHKYLMAHSSVYRNLSNEDKLKALGYAHNQGAGGMGPNGIMGATAWLARNRGDLTQAGGKDGFGTGGNAYPAAIGRELKKGGIASDGNASVGAFGVGGFNQPGKAAFAGAATSTEPETKVAFAAPEKAKSDPYANIPDVDGSGRKGQKAAFSKWNSDPLGNSDKKLAAINPSLAAVVRQMKIDNPDLPFAVGSGMRTQDEEDMAVSRGWSPKSFGRGSLGDYYMKSKHGQGKAVDLWPLDEKGAVQFDPDKMKTIRDAMMAAATKVGQPITSGFDFKKQDKPHFEINEAVKNKMIDSINKANLNLFAPKKDAVEALMPSDWNPGHGTATSGIVGQSGSVADTQDDQDAKIAARMQSTIGLGVGNGLTGATPKSPFNDGDAAKTRNLLKAKSGQTVATASMGTAPGGGGTHTVSDSMRAAAADPDTGNSKISQPDHQAHSPASPKHEHIDTSGKSAVQKKDNNAAAHTKSMTKPHSITEKNTMDEVHTMMTNGSELVSA